MPPPNLAILLLQMQYPGMTYVESEITRAWLNRHGAEYDSIEFNYRLGDGADVGQEYSPETQRMARLLTQKRADIVGRKGDAVELIEVKIRIAFPVIGQLLGYRSLWKLQHPELPVARLLAIGRAVVPDLGPIIAEQGIDIECFPREE